MPLHQFGRLALLGAVAPMALIGYAGAARAQTFTPGDLLISSSTYQDTGAVTGLTVGQQIPTLGVTGLAVADGSGLGVFFNSTPDANFGVTSPLTISQYTTGGTQTLSFNLPAPTGLNVANGVVTSFSSKSEGSLTLSPDGSSVTLMGYDAPVGALDSSNAQTPGGAEPGNTDIASPTYREAATIYSPNNVTYTQTNSYSGNNGRAAVTIGNQVLMIGNAGNGNGSNAVTYGTGVQWAPLGQTNPAAITNQYGPGSSEVGFYSIVQNGYTADKTAKDSNFRGLTVYNNTVYTTKGSGSNGIDTVYQVGNAGSLPTLPATAAPTAANPLASNNPISILPGLTTSLAKKTDDFTPFSVVFANPNTMYVSDEGSGDTVDTTQHAGIDKYSLVSGSWQFDYPLQGTLIGSVQDFSGFGDVTTTGLRQITGIDNSTDTDITLYGVTATTDSITDTNGDTMDAGADPNEVVQITDDIAATTLPTSEDYSTFAGPTLGTVYRGISLAPVPEPTSLLLFGTALLGLARFRRRK